MDKYGQIDQNWYSSESQRHERETAEQVLRKMKELENEFSKSRKVVIEKTAIGVRKKYIKKHANK